MGHEQVEVGMRVPKVRSVKPIQLPWGQAVRSPGWRQIRGSFIQGNKQYWLQKESLNRGHLREKKKTNARNVEVRGEASSRVEK